MNILHKFALCTSLFLAAACTSENELVAPEVPTDGTTAEAPEREVLLTFDNKLKLPQTKAGDEIATEGENRINSLDVYVFAAETEGGTYSFQQLLYYREDAAQTIAQDWAKSFPLMNSEDGKSASAVLKLKKGFFVKLYCVANQTSLRVPDAAAEGGFRVVNINNPGDYFTALSQSNPGAADNVVTAGKPSLAEFEQFSTPLLDATQAADTLFTPLAMVDNSNTALDLRDMTASARLKEGFRLTRLAARFDVVNAIKDIKNADGSIKVKGSNFTITNIYMVKGRPGSSLFPTASCGDVITYPKRKVEERLQTGRVPGCFYAYASPMEDAAYLVLEGLFRINQTETKQVSYPVYFKDANDPSRYLEIQSNHRYTINITAADDYQLNFNVSVAEWGDEGNLDDYVPDNTMDKDTPVVLETEGGATSANVAVNADGAVEITDPAVGSVFAFKMSSNAPVVDQINYGGGGVWLEKVPADATKAAGTMETTFAYQVVDSIADMAKESIRTVTIRLTNQASGSSKVITVLPKFTPEPEPAPEPDPTPDPEPTPEPAPNPVTPEP